MFEKSKDRRFYAKAHICSFDKNTGWDHIRTQQKENERVTKNKVSGFRHTECTVRRPPPQFNKPKTLNEANTSWLTTYSNIRTNNYAVSQKKIKCTHFFALKWIITKTTLLS